MKRKVRNISPAIVSQSARVFNSEFQGLLLRKNPHRERVREAAVPIAAEETTITGNGLHFLKRQQQQEK